MVGWLQADGQSITELRWWATLFTRMEDNVHNFTIVPDAYKAEKETVGDRRYTKVRTQESKGEHRVLPHSMCTCLSGHRTQLPLIYVSVTPKDHLRDQVPPTIPFSCWGLSMRQIQACSPFSLGPAGSTVTGASAHARTPAPSRSPRAPRIEPSGGRKTRLRPKAGRWR